MRFSASVEIVFDFVIHIDVIEAGFIGFGIGESVVAHDNARRFDKARFNGVVQPEIADDPSKEGFLCVGISRRDKRCGREIKASRNAHLADWRELYRPFSAL